MRRTSTDAVYALYVLTAVYTVPTLLVPQVQGIPHVVLLAPDSTVLCGNARAAVSADPNGDNFPWPGAEEPK
jgi:CO dehydrogenase/acetyl-CoA synthase beta subunit